MMTKLIVSICGLHKTTALKMQKMEFNLTKQIRKELLKHDRLFTKLRGLMIPESRILKSRFHYVVR